MSDRDEAPQVPDHEATDLDEALNRAANLSPDRRRSNNEYTPEERAEIQEKFLQALRKYGVVIYAIGVCGASGPTLYAWRKADKEFAEAWEEAIEHSTQAMEARAILRANHMSDRLMEFMLRSRRPHVYQQRQAINATLVGSMNVSQTTSPEEEALVRSLIARCNDVVTAARPDAT